LTHCLKKVNDIRTLDLSENMPGNFTLFLWGDTHLGNVSCSEGTIRRFVAKVNRTKHGFCSLGGDQLECVSVGHPHYSVAVHGSREAMIDNQIAHFEQLFSPLKGKVLWILDGNHEKRYRNMFNVSNRLRYDLACPEHEWGYCSTAKILFPGFRLGDWHGSGSVNSKAGDAHQRERNDEIKVKRKLRDLPFNDCEVSVMHHIHKLRISKPIVDHILVTDPSKGRLEQHYTRPARIDLGKGMYRIPEEERWYASSGAGLSTYEEGVSGYGEDAGFRATELGCIVVRVQNDKMKTVEKCVL
jgi:hypothetical protein